MANLMTRRFTLREKILLIVLVVVLLVGLYFFCVHYPIQNEMADLENQRAECEEDIAKYEPQIAEYEKWEALIKEYNNLPADEKSEIPDFDNVAKLMAKLNDIFLGTEQTLTYSDVLDSRGEVIQKDNIVSRVIRFTFKASSFEKAKEVLTNLTHTEWRCLLSDLTVSPADRDVAHGSLTISGTITFYEFYTGSKDLTGTEDGDENQDPAEGENKDETGSETENS